MEGTRRPAAQAGDAEGKAKRGGKRKELKLKGREREREREGKRERFLSFYSAYSLHLEFTRRITCRFLVFFLFFFFFLPSSLRRFFLRLSLVAFFLLRRATFSLPLLSLRASLFVSICLSCSLSLFFRVDRTVMFPMIIILFFFFSLFLRNYLFLSLRAILSLFLCRSPNLSLALLT